MNAICLTTDLIFSSRLSAAANAVSGEFKTAPSPDALTSQVEDGETKLVIVDLRTANLSIEQLVQDIRTQSNSVAIVAFGPHVQEAKLSAASEAGCDEVLTQGQFNSQIDDLLRKYLSQD